VNSQDAWDAEWQRRVEAEEWYCEDHPDEELPCCICEEKAEELAAVRDLCPETGDVCLACPTGGEDGWRDCQHIINVLETVRTLLQEQPCPP
jgi:hypothetical protein